MENTKTIYSIMFAVLLGLGTWALTSINALQSEIAADRATYQEKLEHIEQDLENASAGFLSKDEIRRELHDTKSDLLLEIVHNEEAIEELEDWFNHVLHERYPEWAKLEQRVKQLEKEIEELK